MYIIYKMVKNAFLCLCVRVRVRLRVRVHMCV